MGEHNGGKSGNDSAKEHESTAACHKKTNLDKHSSSRILFTGNISIIETRLFNLKSWTFKDKGGQSFFMRL